MATALAGLATAGASIVAIADMMVDVALMGAGVAVAAGLTSVGTAGLAQLSMATTLTGHAAGQQVNIDFGGALERGDVGPTGLVEELAGACAVSALLGASIEALWRVSRTERSGEYQYHKAGWDTALPFCRGVPNRPVTYHVPVPRVPRPGVSIRAVRDALCRPGRELVESVHTHVQVRRPYLHAL